jgi:uncharacterized membrane protein
MRTPAQIAGHPIHPMLVALPIGMWVFSLAADLISLRSASPDAWHAAALYTLIGGIIAALAAAVPGVIDMLSLRDQGIKGTAIKHMTINLTVVALYVVNAWLRLHETAGNTPMLLSIVAIALLLVSGWLGGKMVYEAGVAVHAQDTAASTDSWSSARGSRASSAPMGGAAYRGDRAMAADSDRPSRDGDLRDR